MNFEIYQDAANQWRFRLVARNGEIVATSEGYTRRGNVKRACNQIIDDMKRFGTEIKEVKNEQIRKAASGDY